MRVPKSQVQLLLAVVVLAIVAGLFVPTVELLRDSQLLPGGLLQLGPVALLTAFAPLIAIRVGTAAGASHAVTLLLAATAGGLASSLISPYPGAVWGLLSGVPLAYPGSTGARISLSALRWAAAFAVGVVGVSLARRVYMDAGVFHWASLLIFLLTFLVQVGVLRMVQLPRRLLGLLGSKNDNSMVSSSLDAVAGTGDRLARLQTLTANAIGWLMLLLIPLSWSAGWRIELARRIRAIEAVAGRVEFDRSELLTAVWTSMSDGDWGFSDVSALLSDPQMSDIYSDCVRDLLWGPPASNVKLRNPSSEDLRTVQALHGVQSLAITGRNVDDALLADFHLQEDLSALSLRDTKVQGTFLRQSERLRSVTSLYVEASPFTDEGLNQLERLKRATIRSTQITPRGIEQLSRQSNFPELKTDLSLAEELPLLVKLLRHPDARARKFAILRVTRMKPLPLELIPLFVELLDDPDQSRRSVGYHAWSVLTRIGSASTTSAGDFEAVERGLQRFVLAGSKSEWDEAVSLREWAERSLSEMRNVRLARAAALAQESPDQQLPLLVETFWHSDQHARTWAMEKVLEMGPNMVTPALIAALGDPRSTGDCHDIAVEALTRIGAAPKTSQDLFQSIERALLDKQVQAGKARPWVVGELEENLSRMRQARVTLAKAQGNP